MPKVFFGSDSVWGVAAGSTFAVVATVAIVTAVIPVGREFAGSSAGRRIANINKRSMARPTIAIVNEITESARRKQLRLV